MKRKKIREYDGRCQGKLGSYFFFFCFQNPSNTSSSPPNGHSDHLMSSAIQSRGLTHYTLELGSFSSFLQHTERREEEHRALSANPNYMSITKLFVRLTCSFAFYGVRRVLHD